jgi:hypothetical protein
MPYYVDYQYIINAILKMTKNKNNRKCNEWIENQLKNMKEYFLLRHKTTRNDIYKEPNKV